MQQYVAIQTHITMLTGRFRNEGTGVTAGAVIFTSAEGLFPAQRVIGAGIEIAEGPGTCHSYPLAQRLSVRRAGTGPLPTRRRRCRPRRLVELMCGWRGVEPRGASASAAGEEGENGTKMRVGMSNCTRTPVTSAHQSHSSAAPSSVSRGDDSAAAGLVW